MRFSQKQISLLVSALENFLSGSEGELRLYGSRTRDDLKGGDIDLLIVVQSDLVATKLLEDKHYILARIKQNLGDQKIDLKIATSTESASDPFLKSIIPASILLHQWKFTG